MAPTHSCSQKQLSAPPLPPPVLVRQGLRWLAVLSFLCKVSQGHLFMSQMNTVFSTAGSITAMISSHRHKQMHLQENRVCFRGPLLCPDSPNTLESPRVPSQCAVPHTECICASVSVPKAAGHPADWARDTVIPQSWRKNISRIWR